MVVDFDAAAPSSGLESEQLDSGTDEVMIGQDFQSKNCKSKT